MTEIKRAQVVKFHTPNEDEDPEQLYVVLEVFEDGDSSRVKMKTLATDLDFSPILVVLARDLEIDKKNTSGLTKYLLLEKD